MKPLTRLTTFFLLLFVFNSYSQAIQFKKVYGGNGYDYGYSVIQTYDKGYAISGTTSSSGNGNTDAFILKTDSLGILLWHKTFGGINVDQAYSIKETADTGLIIAGYTNSFGHGGYDMYVIKTNKQGDTLWTKTYGGTNWDFAYSIEQTNDKGYIITGGTYSYGNGNEDMYLVKIDSVGDTLWTKTYGGINDEEAKSVKQTSDSGYVITGYTKSFGAGNSDIYYIKTNIQGDTLWTKTVGNIGVDMGTSIIQKIDGGYALAGYVYDTALSVNQAITINTTGNGDIIWTMKNGAPNDAASNTIIQANDGKLVWAGKLNLGGQNDIYLYKYGLTANWIFSTTFGTSNGNEEAFCIQQTSDLGYIIVGTTNGIGFGLNDIFLVKTDSTGFSSGSIVIGINDIEKIQSNINIYPNPFSENTTIKINLPEINNTPLLFSVFDEMGKMVIVTQNVRSLINNKEVTFELNGKDLNSGIYFLRLIAPNAVYNKKFIVQH